VLEGGNLVYCAPTSGGKSLVAEVLMLRRVIATRRPALLVLPYVSLCGQKAAALEALLRPVGLEVKELYGAHHSGTLLTANTGEGVVVLLVVLLFSSKFGPRQAVLSSMPVLWDTVVLNGA
jgi:DNA polymerase theta